jgi:predicted DNA-binding antitoxin AbrB/MazE fold protein
MVGRIMIKRIKGIYQRGVIHLEEPLALPDGAHVRVTVVPTEQGRDELQEMDESSWDVLAQLLSDCAIDTGFPDFARSHDRYLYGSDSLGRD